MQTDVDLKQVRIAVTGGTSGLGLALVRHLRARGAPVAFIARTVQAVEQITNETGAYGIVGDIGRKEDIKRGRPIAPIGPLIKSSTKLCHASGAGDDKSGSAAQQPAIWNAQFQRGHDHESNALSKRK